MGRKPLDLATFAWRQNKMRREITVRHCQERLARYDTLPPPRLHNASHANHSRYQIGRRRKREREREKERERTLLLQFPIVLMHGLRKCAHMLYVRGGRLILCNVMMIRERLPERGAGYISDYMHRWPWVLVLGGGTQYIRVSKSSYVTK